MNFKWKPRGHNCGWGAAPTDARLLLWALLETNENSPTLQRPWGQNSFLQDKHILAPLLYYAHCLKMEIYSGKVLNIWEEPADQTGTPQKRLAVHQIFVKMSTNLAMMTRPSDSKQSVGLPEVTLHLQSNDLRKNSAMKELLPSVQDIISSALTALIQMCLNGSKDCGEKTATNRAVFVFNVWLRVLII